MENRVDLRKELKEIEKWEKDQKGLFFWEKLGRLPFALLDKVTPKFLQEKINSLLDEIATYIDNGGQYLVNNEATLKKAAKVLSSMNLLWKKLKNYLFRIWRRWPNPLSHQSQKCSNPRSDYGDWWVIYSSYRYSAHSRNYVENNSRSSGCTWL